jgi:hypothetical protein
VPAGVGSVLLGQVDPEASVRPMVRGLVAPLAAVLGLVLLVGGPAVAAPSPSPSKAVHAAPAKPLKSGDLVVLSGDVVVRRDESSGDVVVIHGSARIAGVVRGDVVVVDGPIVISGLVRGDLVALDGGVTLLSGAHVTGDVTVARGGLVVQVGALIGGRVHRGGLAFLSPSKLVTKLGFWIGISVSTLLLGLLLILLAPRAGDAVARAGRDAVGASIGWGALAVFGLPVLAVLLLVSLVGLPFGLGLLLALALLYSIGYAYAGIVVGRLLVRPSRHGGPRLVSAFLAGWVILRAVGFVPLLGGITWFLAAWYGLGAATVAVWRARRPPVVLRAPGPDPGFTTTASSGEPVSGADDAAAAVPAATAERPPEKAPPAAQAQPDQPVGDQRLGPTPEAGASEPADTTSPDIPPFSEPPH